MRTEIRALRFCRSLSKGNKLPHQLILLGLPWVIDVFDGNGVPSGPNYLLFSDVDRFADSLWDRSGVGWSPTLHAPVLELPRELWIEIFGKSWSRAVERKGPVLMCIYRWERPRMRRRRLHMSSSDPRRLRGDLRTTNRQDSTDAPAMVASSVSRHQEINFFGPQ